jgi:exonuclease III
VNDVRKRLPLLLAWLDAMKPDIVALQELKVVDAAFPRAELQAAGYGSLHVGQKTWNGVAVLARGAEPIETAGHCPVTRVTTRRAIWKQPSRGSSSRRCTCPTATRFRGRSSTTSWPGSNA